MNLAKAHLFLTGRLDPTQKDPASRAGSCYYAGDHLISHTLTRAVPSAQRGLTSVFGMGTGVTLAVNSPANLRNRALRDLPQLNRLSRHITLRI